jgi:hypothetical protein
MNKRFFSQFILIFIVMLLAGCVGVIEELKPPTTKGQDIPTSVLPFQGIHAAVPISNERVEVFFFPASGTPDTITYVISYDGSPNPETVPGETLRPDFRGLLRHTIKGLTIDSSYSFKVEAFDSTGRSSSSNKVVSAKTFSNKTAIFDGVGSVNNTSGSDSFFSLTVNWTEAIRLGNDFIANEVDVYEYVITILDGDFLSPADLFNPIYTEPLRRQLIVPGNQKSRKVTGLRPGTEYHIHVAAMHHGLTQPYGANPSYLSESNSRYITMSTLANDESGVIYEPSNITANRLNGSAGLTSARVEWDAVVGGFDHIRIYYAPQSIAFNQNTHVQSLCAGPAPGIDIPCKKMGFNDLSTIVTGLAPLTLYEFNVLICMDADCSARFTFNAVTTYTDPGVANFNGVLAINDPANVNELGSLNIIIDPIDLNSGNINGLIVELMERTAGDGPFADTILNHPTDDDLNTTQFEVLDFDYTNAQSIRVRGINSTSPIPYCFKVYPYTYDESNEIVMHSTGVVPFCHGPSLSTPTAAQFQGIASNIVDLFFPSVTLTFTAPTSGLYSEYRLFYRYFPTGDTVTNFSFSDAVNNQAGYFYYQIPSSAELFTLDFLPPGTYQFGLLSNFPSLSSPTNPGGGFSDFNANINIVTIPEP